MKKIADVIDNDGNVITTVVYEYSDDNTNPKRIGEGNDNNNNHHNRKNCFKFQPIVIVVIPIVIIAVIFLMVYSSNSNTSCIDVELNDSVAVAYEKKQSAINNATLIANVEPSYILLSVTSYGDVRIQLDGQDSGTHLFAETSDKYEEIGIYTPGETGVLAIKFNIDDFEEGEIVLVTFTFNIDDDDLFNQETQYFAFIIGSTS